MTRSFGGWEKAKEGGDDFIVDIRIFTHCISLRVTKIYKI
jgi:hypothetical protein